MKFGVVDEKSLFCKQIVNELKNNHLSHAYLIETNNNSFDVVRDYILFFVKKIYENCYNNSNISIPMEKVLNLVDKNEFPDYIEVLPETSQIKKEQMLEVKEKFKNKSVFGTKQVYVIYEANKMNTSCSNTILKFLEEPSEGIVGIFVVNNRYNVLDTILSRCQVLTLDCVENTSIELTDDEIKFLENIKNRNSDDLLLHFDEYFNSIFKDKESSINSLKKFSFYYNRILNNFSDEFYSIENLVYIISIFEENLKKLKYNVNIKLWLDNLLISLMEV